ncbi:hypothetical protein D3C85_1433720 [compost metagenome]
MKACLRPYLSVKDPVKNTPIMQPISAELTKTPSCAGDSPKNCLTNGKAPAITAISNPKRSPPSETMHKIIIKFLDIPGL